MVPTVTFDKVEYYFISFAKKALAFLIPPSLLKESLTA
jgi:hypothetical protein